MNILLQRLINLLMFCLPLEGVLITNNGVSLARILGGIVVVLWFFYFISIRREKLEFSFTSYSVIDGYNNIISYRKVNKDGKYDDLIKSNYIGLSTVMFQKKLLKYMKFPNLKTQEDFALWLKLLKKGYKLTHMKQNLSSWRKTENSLSSHPIQKISDAFKLYYKIENKNLTLSIYSVLVLVYNKIKKLT